MNNEEDEPNQKLPPHLHDLVKHKEHGGECRKCGLLGSWALIKSLPCNARKPDGCENSMVSKLDAAIKDGNAEAAHEALDEMEMKMTLQSIQDEEIALQLMEEELLLHEMIELQEQMKALELEEAEASMLEAAKKESLSSGAPESGDVSKNCSSSSNTKKSDPLKTQASTMLRPQATPSRSCTITPKVMVKPPEACF